MHEVRVNIVNQLHRLPKGCRSLGRPFFMDVSMNRIPILLDCLEVTKIRFMNPESDAKVLHLQQVTTDALEPLQMASPWSNTVQ